MVPEIGPERLQGCIICLAIFGLEVRQRYENGEVVYYRGVEYALGKKPLSSCKIPLLNWVTPMVDGDLGKCELCGKDRGPEDLEKVSIFL